MKRLLNSFFIFALSVNLLFIGSVAPVHGQSGDEDVDLTCDTNGDGIVDEAEAAECETDDGESDNDNNGHGTDPDGCNEDNPGNGDRCYADADDTSGEETADDTSGEETADNTSGEETADNTSGEETADDTSGEETADDTSGEETADDTSGEEAADDTSGEETADDTSGEETADDTSGEETADNTSGEETADDTSGEETADDTSGEETADDTSGEETADDTSGEETADDTSGEETADDTSGEETADDTSGEEAADDGTTELQEGPIDEESTGDSAPSALIDSAEGEIGDAAVPGSFNSEAIIVQNIGTGAGTATLELFTTSSTPVDTFSKPVFQGGAATFPTSSFSSNGQFSGVISSDEPMVAAVYNTNHTGRLADMYLGTNVPVQEVNLPLIFRKHFNNESTFFIQNAHSATQDITVDVFPEGQTVAADSVTYSNVPPNTSITVDFANDTDYDGFGSGNGAVGYALVTGSAGNVAAVSQTVRDLGTDRFMTSYNGLDNVGGAGPNLVAPLVYSNWFDWITGITVVNTEGTPTTVTLNYFSNKGNGSDSLNLGANAVGVFFLPFVGPDISFGSATINSTGNDIIAMVNNARASQGFGSATVALDASTATDRVAIPLIRNSNGGNAWRSGITVYSFGNTTVTADFVAVDSNPTGNTTTPTPLNLSANEVGLLFGPFFLPSSNYTGVLYLSSSGGNIMALNNTSNLVSGFSGQIPGINY